MRAKSPGQNHTVNLINAHFIHQQFKASMKRSFGQLDGADIILQNRDGITDAVFKGPAVCFNPVGAAGQAAVNHPICGDQTGQIHLPQSLNNARATNAGDAGISNRLIKPIFI